MSDGFTEPRKQKDQDSIVHPLSKEEQGHLEMFDADIQRATLEQETQDHSSTWPMLDSGGSMSTWPVMDSIGSMSAYVLMDLQDQAMFDMSMLPPTTSFAGLFAGESHLLADLPLFSSPLLQRRESIFDQTTLVPSCLPLLSEDDLLPEAPTVPSQHVYDPLDFLLFGITSRQSI